MRWAGLRRGGGLLHHWGIRCRGRKEGVGVIGVISEDIQVVGRVFVEGVFEVVRLGFFTGIEVGEVFGVSGWPGILGADEAETLAMPEWDEVPPGPPFVAGLGHADREKVEESHPTLVDGLVEDLLDEGVDLLLVGEFTGHLGVGGEGPGEDAEVAGDLDVVDGALAQEAVGQGAEEGDFAFHAGAVGRQAGQGRADSGEGAAAMGPSASDVSTAPDGSGFLPRRITAGIRFYAGHGGAGIFFRGALPQASASAPRARRSGISSAAHCRRHPLLRRARRSGHSSAVDCRGHPREGRAGGADQPPLEQASRRGVGGRGLTRVCIVFWMGTWSLGRIIERVYCLSQGVRVTFGEGEPSRVTLREQIDVALSRGNPHPLAPPLTPQAHLRPLGPVRERGR